MNYKVFKQARKLWHDDANKELVGKIKDCEDMLKVLDWLKSNENKDEEGKPRYKATITLNIVGREEEDSDEMGSRSLTYDSNFEFVEKKVRENYDKLIKEFEKKTEE